MPTPERCVRCGGTEDLMDRGMAPGMTYCAPCRKVLSDAPRQNRRSLISQLLGAIEAWEDALTDEERDAQEMQAHALLGRLMTGDVCGR